MDMQAILIQVLTFGLPALVLMASLTKILPVKNTLALGVISFVLLYVFIVINAQMADVQIEKELNEFDLNHDGAFSPEEMTPDAKRAMDRYSNDTGRVFAPFTGFVFSLIYVILFYGVVALVRRFNSKEPN